MQGEGGEITPPYLSVAFEPATGRVIDSRTIHKIRACDVYDDMLWGFIQSYLCQDLLDADGAKHLEHGKNRPATLTSTDVALADYVFGVIQGCGTEVQHVTASTPVQWPATLDSGGLDREALEYSEHDGKGLKGELLIGDAIEHLRASLQRDPRTLQLMKTTDGLQEAMTSSAGGSIDGEVNQVSVASDGHARTIVHMRRQAQGFDDMAHRTVKKEAAPLQELILMGACQNIECMRLIARKSLKRCSGCKRANYCSVKCQTHDWESGHKQRCAEIRLRERTNRPKQSSALILN